MALKVPSTYVHKKLGMSTVVAWELSHCITVETKVEGSALDLSDRKILPSHVVIADSVGGHTGAVVLPSAASNDSRAITVVNNDADEAITVGGASCPADSTTIVYSDGTNWVAL